MINSARYYPSLTSSINYGGLRFLSEFKLIKQYMSYIGDIKLCNIVINCQNISIARGHNNDNNSSNKIQDSLTNLIDNIALVASHSTSGTASNWLSDRDLGAGVLNRYGAAMISLMLHLFEDKKVTKVYGSLKTFIDDFDTVNKNEKKLLRQNSLEERKKSDRTNSPVPDINSNNKSIKQNQIRRITADDHCTFQMRLDSILKSNDLINNKKNINKNSIMVTVVINSLAHCKYSQEILLCGNEGAIEWKNSSIFLKSNSNNTKINEFIKNNHKIKQQLDNNNNNVTNNGSSSSDVVDNNYDQDQLIETELKPSLDDTAEKYLKQFQNLENKYPELPLLYIRGLYYYLAHVKNSFQESNKNNNNNNNNIIDNFEHTHLVQSIIKNISLSNESNRWVPVNY